MIPKTKKWVKDQLWAFLCQFWTIKLKKKKKLNISYFCIIGSLPSYKKSEKINKQILRKRRQGHLWVHFGLSWPNVWKMRNQAAFFSVTALKFIWWQILIKSCHSLTDGPTVKQKDNYNFIGSSPKAGA